MLDTEGQGINYHIPSFSYGQNPYPSGRGKWKIINRLLYSLALCSQTKATKKGTVFCPKAGMGQQHPLECKAHYLMQRGQGIKL